MKFQLKPYQKYLIPLLVMVIASIFYFSPQLEGKVLRQGDIVQFKGMAQEQVKYREAENREILWTNSMFGGMPTYQIAMKNPYDILKYIGNALSMFMERPIGYFVLGMFSFYIMLILLGVSPWLSLVGALLFGFSTNNLILLDAGHNNKLVTIFLSPLVISGVLLVLRQRYLLGAFIFGVGFGLNVNANHPQMTYYLGICLAILVIAHFINLIRTKQGLLPFTKAMGVLAIMALLGMGSSATRLWTTYEYSKDTMRGDPILQSQDNVTASSSNTKGLDWEYAMQWSNGGIDLLSTFIPKAAGGGSGEWLDGKSSLAKAIGQRQSFQAPTYWGPLPFTSGPAYFGALALFLFVFGLFAVRGTIKWWLAIALFLTMLLSLGKNFEFLNRLFFDYLPLYNKFRTPNSILSVTAIFVPLLGILGLAEVLRAKERSQYLKPLYIASGIMGGLALLMWVAGTSLFDFSAPGDAQFEQLRAQIVTQREEMFAASSLRSLFFVLIPAAMLWLFITQKIKIVPALLILVIGLAGFIDLMQIDLDYFNKKSFASKRAVEGDYIPRAVDNQILADNDPYFRVFDLTVNTFNNAIPSYFHKTIGGYHAAKLQRYQDLIDRHIMNNNQAVLNMLNTKYYILNSEEGRPIVQRNPQPMGNAWFVYQLELVEDANAEIEALIDFDPASTAFVNQEFSDYISSFIPEKNGSIRLSSYVPDRLEYEFESQSEQFVVFSDIWYGPGKGWQAYIDGNPADHIRVNYALRGMRVPAGNHSILFEFKPVSYFTGKYINLISSLLIFALGGYVIYLLYRKKLRFETEAQF
jgi:hypothetical protein